VLVLFTPFCQFALMKIVLFTVQGKNLKALLAGVNLSTAKPPFILLELYLPLLN